MQCVTAVCFVYAKCGRRMPGLVRGREDFEPDCFLNCFVTQPSVDEISVRDCLVVSVCPDVHKRSRTRLTRRLWVAHPSSTVPNKCSRGWLFHPSEDFGQVTIDRLFRPAVKCPRPAGYCTFLDTMGKPSDVLAGLDQGLRWDFGQVETAECSPADPRLLAMSLLGYLKPRQAVPQGNVFSNVSRASVEFLSQMNQGHDFGRKRTEYVGIVRRCYGPPPGGHCRDLPQCDLVETSPAEVLGRGCRINSISLAELVFDLIIYPRASLPGRNLTVSTFVPFRSHPCGVRDAAVVGLRRIEFLLPRSSGITSWEGSRPFMGERVVVLELAW